MKKAFALTVLMLILALSGVGLWVGSVYAARDQIVITERVADGDRSAADGVVISTNNTYNDHLYWQIRHKIGAQEDQTTTEYEFYAMGKDISYAFEPDGVLLENYSVYGFDEKEENPIGLAVAYKELYDSLEPGEEGTRIVKLRDYLEYYPVQVTLDLPGAEYIYCSEEERIAERSSELDETSALFAAMYLQEYFRIPVMEEEQVEIQIGKSAVSSRGETAETSSIGSASLDDGFTLITQSAIGDEVCYFTFNTYSFQGKVVDTSKIAGGYGIYALPYSAASKDGAGYDIRNLANVYPMDPETYVIDLLLSNDQTRLLLHTVEDGQYVITVIDIETMEAVQKLIVCEWDDSYGWYLYEGEDYFCILLSGEEEVIAVISETEGGQYQTDFAVKTDPGYGYIESADYDGEKLVLANYYGYGYSTSYYVAVFDASGLLYFGEYDTSLSVENQTASSYVGSQKQAVYYESTMQGCEQVWQNPIKVEWEE